MDSHAVDYAPLISAARNDNKDQVLDEMCIHLFNKIFSYSHVFVRILYDSSLVLHFCVLAFSLTRRTVIPYHDGTEAV